VKGHETRARGRSFGLVAVVAAFMAAAFVPSLTQTATAASCPAPSKTVNPFLPWGDANDYVLTTGGSFEPVSPSWTLRGGATVVSGDNAPNALDPVTDSHALYLPPGSSATSACTTAPKIVGIVRFFVKSAALTTGQLRVEVLVKGSVYQAGTITAGALWEPSPMLVSDAPAYSGSVAYQVRLTPIGTDAAFTVDDVYFDPYCSC
jgi:hypothetical protein